MNQKCNNPAPRTWTILLREVLLRLLQETDVCEISFSSFWESILSVIIFTNKNENNTTVLIKENCIEANVKSVFQICPDNMEGEKSFLFLSLSLSLNASHQNKPVSIPISEGRESHTHTHSSEYLEITDI